VNLETIPQRLTTAPHWVCWRMEEREGKPTKVPYDPRTSKKAKSNNPATWCSFETAVAGASAADSGYDGIGYMFSDDDQLTGIDLDKCIDESGVLDPSAAEIVADLNSYTEITPSGRGLHIIVEGAPPSTKCRKGGVEIYHKTRYFTVTGRQWPGTPQEIAPRQDALESLYSATFEPIPESILNGNLNGHAHTNGHTAPISLSDEDLLRIAFEAKNGAKVRDLWAGNTGAYGNDESAADLALCSCLQFYTGPDEARIDSWFRRSGLMRPKWDTRHSGDGLTYGQLTIRKALEGKTEFYKPKGETTPTLRGSKARAYIQGKQEPDEVGDDFEDEADEIDDTRAGPYGIRNGCTVFAFDKTDKSKQTISTETVVCDFAAHITEEIISEDGQRSFLIKGRSIHGRSFEVDVTADQFADDRQLKTALIRAAGAKTGIRAGMGKHLMPAIDKFTKDPFQRRQYHRTGWDNGKFLLPGREESGVSIHLPDKLPYGINSKADLKKGIECLESLILAQDATVSTIPIAAAFQAPLSLLAGWRNERYAIFITGRTGSLKSTWAQHLMTLYGPEFRNNDLLIRWDGTANAIMKLAIHAHDLPLLIDNYKPNTGERGNEAARKCITMIHSILEGREKDRLNRSSELRDSKPIFCWPFITGEDIPDTDTAALARVLVIPFAWQRGEDNPNLTHVQALASHLCAVGGAWLDWLETDDGRAVAQQAKERFEGRRSIWATHLRTVRKDMANILRVASNLASNQLTWEVMGACPALRAVVEKYTDAHTRGLEVIAGSMAVHTTESLEAHRFLAALNELVSTGQCLLMGPDQTPDDNNRDRVIGYADPNGIYILPEKARERADRLLAVTGGLNGISNAALYKQLDSLGKIADKGEVKATKVKRVAGGVVRVIHLKANAFDADE
jgi:putative DNA primase/helicase